MDETPAMSTLRLRDIQIRDPFMLCHDGYYYLYGSTDPDIWRGPAIGFDCYRGSGEGVWTHFERAAPAFRPPLDFWACANFWAPEVYAYDDAFFMFATFKPREGCRGTAVLRAESPLGPFRPWSDGPVTPAEWECLDGTLYRDDDGDPWMVFCHEWQQVGDGQICAQRLTSDLKTTIAESAVLFRASQAPWSAPLTGRPPGSYVTDGPFVWRLASGALAMLWSSFDTAGSYCLGVATSLSGGILGPWQQSDTALSTGDAGHGMVFAAPGGGLYLAVHSPNRTPNERARFVGLAETATGFILTGETIQ